MVVETVNLMESPNETSNTNIKSLNKDTINLKFNSSHVDKKETSNSICGPLCGLEPNSEADEANNDKDCDNIINTSIPNEDQFKAALQFCNYSFNFKQYIFRHSIMQFYNEINHNSIWQSYKS